MFNEIFELKALREQKIEMSERELVLSKPKITDLKLIPAIYNCFCEIHADIYNNQGNRIKFPAFLLGTRHPMPLCIIAS